MNARARKRPERLLAHVDVKKLGRIPKGGGHKIHGRAATHNGERRRQRTGYERQLPAREN